MSGDQNAWTFFAERSTVELALVWSPNSPRFQMPQPLARGALLLLALLGQHLPAARVRRRRDRAVARRPGSVLQVELTHRHSPFEGRMSDSGMKRSGICPSH